MRDRLDDARQDSHRWGGSTTLGALSRTLDPERRPSALDAETCRAAMEDAGLDTEAVDGMHIWPPGTRSPW
jgi:hypothetical protein